MLGLGLIVRVIRVRVIRVRVIRVKEGRGR